MVFEDLCLELEDTGYAYRSLLFQLVPHSSSARAAKDRYLNSPDYRHNLTEALKLGLENEIYPNLDFLEWVQGYEIGWTERGR